MQNRSKKIKRIALMGMLFAAAMALSVLEGMLPAMPFLPPGVKLGLSNIVTMYTLFCLGTAQGVVIAVLKSLFVLLTRSATGAVMSFAGGMFSVAVMWLLSRLPQLRKNYLLVSIFGAIFHNVGQLVAARYLIGTPTVLYQLPLMILSGIGMGIITGLVLRVVMPYIEKLTKESGRSGN